MKKLIILLLSIVSIALISSCDKGELGPVANTTDPGTPSLEAPNSGQSYTLTEGEAENTLMTVEWTEPDFGFSAAPTYSIQIAEAGSDSGFVSLGTTQETSFDVVVKAFNNLLLKEKFAANNTHALDLRVSASISDSVTKAVSEPVSISVTPYLVEVNYPKIYVPGGYQSSSGYTTNWEPADAPPLFSVNDDDNYEGYVYIANGGSQYKFTAERNWQDGDWGTSGTEGELESPGNNIVASSSGYYKMNVNLNDLTYSTEVTDWAVTGSATPNGWAGDNTADHDMTYDPQTKVWSLDLSLSAGELKFRANDAWELAYGDVNGNGRLDTENENNIAVEESGNYTIILDLSDAPYTYELQKN
ncbi:SusE domain-containing protein [Fodinibius halophilus]|uniref:SusF/SusE family outer membrane protein n=1 Tax=Fodinibius halophilus TaxID=1736908 RepID=A0A6M1SSX5_9BACT|nr:SusE domain-containing protein [Fodinibius halophilus]NGP87038.1 SusF/SusE family outer membrane protein [Fodinibius halophilus]